jgi:DNA-binding phage protein
MENIGREIKRLIKKERASVYKMAEDLGLANESLYRSLKNGGNPEWKRIKQILDYLGYDLKFIKRKEVKEVKSRPSKKSKTRR